MKRGVRNKLSRYSSVDLERLVRFEALYRKAVLSSADARKQYPELLKTYKQLLENASPAAQRVAYEHVQEVYQLAQSARSPLKPALWIFIALVAVFSLTLFLQPSITGLFSSDVVPSEPSSNHAPLWSGSSDVLQVSENGALDLSGLFRDEDGDVLTYLVQPNEGILASVDGSVAQLAFEPGVSRGTLTVIASDGQALAQHTIAVQKAGASPEVTPTPVITPEPVVSPTPVTIQEPVVTEESVTTEQAFVPSVDVNVLGPAVTDGSVVFRDREGNALAASTRYAPSATKLLGIAVDPDIVSVDVELQNSVIKRALVEDLRLSTATNSVLEIDDVPEDTVPQRQGSPDWSEIYAINPTAEFSSAELTVNAKGNRLLKCAGWDFDSRSCAGGWKMLQRLKPGEPYTITISATDPAFAEIDVTDAVHLDESYGFVDNVYDQVVTEDDVWTDDIPVGHVVRATFEEDLTNENVINLRVRSSGGHVVVFEEGTTHEVGRIETVSPLARPDVTLQGVTAPSDTFDFLVVGAPVAFDFIHDNPGTTGFFMYTNSTTGSSTFIGRPVYQNWTGSNMAGNDSSAEGAIPDLGLNITNIVSRCSRARDECYFGITLSDRSSHLLMWQNATRNWTNYTLTNVSGQELINQTLNLDIECEDESGECLVVYENLIEGDDKFAYRTITGDKIGVVSSEQIATVRTEIPPTKSYLLINSSFSYLKLYPQYGSNLIGLGWQTNHTAPTIGGGMWDGDAFHNFTNFTALGSAAPIKYNRLFDCAWEGLSQEFDCFWGSTQNGLNRSDWNPNSSTWTSRGSVSAEATHVINDVTMCGTTPRTRDLKKKTDMIGYLTCDTANDFNGSVWNGSANVIMPGTLLEDTASECGNSKIRGTTSIVCGLETSGNQFVFVWPDANALIPEFGTYTISTNTWSHANWATGTATATVTFSGLDDVDYLELTPSPVTDEMMLIGTNIVRGSNCSRWTGSTFSQTGCNTKRQLMSYGNGQPASFDWYRYERFRCPMNVNESIDLDTNTTAPRSCLNITGDNLTVNCNGNTMWFDSWGYGNTTGILVQNAVNVTIANCNIVDASLEGSGSTNILFSNVSQGRIINTTVIGNGTSNITGIVIQNSSVDVLIDDTFVDVFTSAQGVGVRIQNASNRINLSSSNVSANGTNGQTYALAIESLSANGTILNNNLSAISPHGVGIWLFNSNNTNFSNNVISNTTNWIIANEGNFANFSDTTFENGFGSVKFTPRLGFNGTRVVNQTYLNITYNLTRLNGTNLSWLNNSATIELTGLTLESGGTAMDGEDDGTFSACPASKCSVQSYSAGVLTFNVSSWTSFAGAEPAAFACGSIASSTTMTGPATASGGCFTLDADNIVFDCAGYSITFDTAGMGNVSAISANGRNNVNITNCVITDGAAGGTFGIGINFTNTNSSHIWSNTITTAGTLAPIGILLRGSNNGSVMDNLIVTQGVSNQSDTSENTTRAIGIWLTEDSNFNNVSRNAVTTNGKNFSIGIYLGAGLTGSTIDPLGSGASNNSIAHNWIKTNGTAERNYGIYLNVSSSQNNITNNSVLTKGNTFNEGIRLENSTDNIIDGNNISTNGTLTGNDGFGVFTASYRTTVRNNLVATNGTSTNYGVRTQGGSNYSSYTNNTFRTNGSSTDNYGFSLSSVSGINITDNVIYSHGSSLSEGIDIVTGTYTIVRNNSITLKSTIDGSNSANLGIFMGTSSSFNIIVGNYIETNGTGANKGIQISSGENNSIENNTIWAKGNGSNNYGVFLTGTATMFNNVTGNQINTSGNNSNYGVYLASNSRNALVQYNNISIFSVNSSNQGTGGVVLISHNNTILGNNIMTAGVALNYGVWFFTPSENNTLVNNTIRTQANGTSNFGVYFQSVARNSAIGNNISTNGTDTNNGIRLSNANYTLIQNNTIYSNGTSSFNFGILGFPGNNYTRIIGNFIHTGGTNDNDAINLQIEHNNNSVLNNTIHAGGTTSQNAGIALNNAYDSNASGNIILTDGGTTGAYGIYVNGSRNIISNNTINATGDSTLQLGIYINGNGKQEGRNLIEGNNITTTGTNQDYGIALWGATNQPVFNNTVHNNRITFTNASDSAGLYMTGALNNNITNLYLYHVASWIRTVTTGGAVGANITNITFAMPNASLRIPDQFNITGAIFLNHSDLNLTFNNSKLNHSLFNRSAFITFNVSAMGFVNPDPVINSTVHAAPNWYRLPCNAANCTEVSYSATTGEYVINVSYAAFAFGVVQGADATCGTITSNTLLSTSVTGTGTCYTFGDDNLTLDCAGNTITFDTDGTGAAYGVFADGRVNVTVQNCIIIDGNNLGESNVGINLTRTNNSFLTSNTIYVNGTGITAGIMLNNVLRTNVTGNLLAGAGAYGMKLEYVNDSNITSNTIFANATSGGVAIDLNVGERNVFANNEGQARGTSADGIVLQNAPFNVIDRNNLTAHRRPGGASSPQSNNAVYLGSDSNYVRVSNNILRTNSTNDGNFGLALASVFGVNVTNNTIYTLGLDGNPAIDIFNGGNNSIINNTLYPNGTSSDNIGIRVRTLAISPSNVSQNNISYNYIQTFGTVTNFGIYLSVSALNNTVAHNRIFTNGSAGFNYGIAIDQGSGFNNITNNTILTNGTTNNHGIAVSLASSNNSFEFNNITTQNPNSYGISISASEALQFANTTLNALPLWMTVDATAFANFTNTRFDTQFGSIVFPLRLAVNGTLNVTQDQLNVTLNRTFVNSTNLSVFNSSAFGMLTGLSLVDPSVAVDYEDDGTYALCPADTCTANSYAGGVFKFNVSHWTSFAGFEGPIISCKTITSSGSFVVGADILGVATPSCINISASDVVLDCQGYRITGSRTANTHGINSSVFNNITIKNCFIANFSDGIFLARNKNATVFNNTVLNNTDDGIELSRTNYSVVSHNNATDNGDNGIVLTSAWTNNVTNNTAQHSIGSGASSHGIQALSDSQENLFINNTVLDNLNDGISIYESSNNTLLDNWAIRNGDDGFAITNSSYTFLNHSVAINSSGTGITLSFTNYSRVSFVNSSVSATTTLLLFNTSNTNITNSSFGPAKRDVIRLALTSINTLFNNVTLVGNGSNWVNVTTENTLVTNFTNTLFLNESTSVRFDRNFSVAPGGVITGSKLNLSLNRVLLNASNLTWLNTSANITLDGVSFTDPQAIVDYTDFDSYSACPEDTCTETSYVGTTFRFNVSHWTSYSSRETSTVEYNFTNMSIVKFDAWDPVNITGLVNYSILLNFTNGSFYGVNVSDLYPANTRFNVSTPAPASGTNDTFNLGDFSPGTVFMINITLNVLDMPNYTIMNNTVNVSWSNESLMRMNQSNMTNTTALVIPSTCGEVWYDKVLNVDVNSTGNCFSIMTSNIALDCNGKTIFWDGEGAAINATSLTNITVQNCFIIDNSTSGSNTVGINFTNITIGLIRNNTILTNDTSGGIGIAVQGIPDGDPFHIAIVNNTMNVSGSANDHNAIKIEFATIADTDINISNNSIIATGTSDITGVSLINASQVSFFRNYLFVSGTSGMVGINGIRSSTLKYNFLNASKSPAGGGSFGSLINYSKGGEGNNISFNNLSHSGSTGQGNIVTSSQNLSNISDNIFFGAGTGITFNGVAANVTLNRNNFSLTGTTAIAVQSSTNFTAINTFFRAGNSVYSSTVAGENATLQNATIENVTGKITFRPSINITGSRTFTTAHYNVSQNRSTVRASVVEFMNVSADIVFNALTYTNAMAVFDPGESGLYSRCSESLCTNTSYDGSVFKFNVSHWSTFAAQEYAPPNTQCEVLRNNSRLENDVNTSGTCFILAENNIVLDCNNHRILFDQDGGGGDAGVRAKDVINVTVQNCIIQDMNAGGAFGVGINFTNVSQSTIKKNVIWTNGTTNNYGVIIQNSPLTNLVANNSIITQGSGTANTAISLSSASFVNITDNTIFTNGTTSNYGVSFVSSVYNISIFNNTIITNGTSTTNDAISIGSINGQSNITNNTLFVSGTGTAVNLVAATALANISILNNLIDTQSSGAANKGVLSTVVASSIFIINNTFLTRSNAIDICSGCIVWTIDGNRINVTGTASSNGIAQTGSAQGYNITNNIINVFGTSTARGLSMSATSGAYNITNNRIYVNGTTSVGGVVISSASQTEIVNNTIIQNSTGATANVGLSFSGSHVRILKTAIWGAGGAGGATLRAEGFNASIDNVTLVAEGPGFSAFNNRVVNLAFNVSNATIVASNDWMNMTGGTNISFTNITFVTGNGSINYPNQIISNNTYVLNKTHFDIRNNRAFENGTNNSAWNQSANVVLDLTGLLFTDPGPGVDYEDDGSYVTCPADVCTEQSFAGNLFKFNVSHWTSFDALETSGITITRPVNIIPPNDTTTTDRIINFNWSNATTSDGSPVSYQLVIATSSTFSPASIIYNKTNIDPIAGNSTNQTINFSLDVDTTYWWRVVGNSSTTFSEPSNISNFTVESLLSLVLLNNSVNFSYASLGTQNDTDDNLPYPFRLENNGNLPINISISSTRLFISGTTDYPTNTYRFKIRANESNSFNESASNTSYINFTPAALGINIKDLNWTNLSDDALVDVNITVPMDEAAGLRNATVTFAVV